MEKRPKEKVTEGALLHLIHYHAKMSGRHCLLFANTTRQKVCKGKAELWQQVSCVQSHRSICYRIYLLIADKRIWDHYDRISPDKNAFLGGLNSQIAVSIFNPPPIPSGLANTTSHSFNSCRLIRIPCTVATNFSQTKLVCMATMYGLLTCSKIWTKMLRREVKAFKQRYLVNIGPVRPFIRYYIK